jgi:hypothetical protein
LRATSAAERGDDFWGPRAISGLSWPKAPRPVRKQTNRGEKPNNDRKRGCDLIRWASQHITLPEAVLALTPTKSQEIIIAHPSPLSAPFAYALAVATDAASKAEIPCDCNRIGPAHGIPGDDEREVVPIDWAGFGKDEPAPDDVK